MYSSGMNSGGFGLHPSPQQPANPWDNFRLEDGAQLSLSLGGDVHPYQQVQNYLGQHDPLGLFSFGVTQDGNNLNYTFRQKKHGEGPYAGYYILPDNPSSLALRKPDLYGEQQIADYLAKNPHLAPQPTGDPFMEFLLNQLGIAGLNQQPQLSAENQKRVRFGREPLPQLQPPPPPTLFETTLNQLRGVDSLLAQLLSGIQSQPAPPVFNTGMRLF